MLLSAYAPSRVIAARVDQNGYIDGSAARVREASCSVIAALNPHLQLPSAPTEMPARNILIVGKLANRSDQPRQPEGCSVRPPWDLERPASSSSASLSSNRSGSVLRSTVARAMVAPVSEWGSRDVHRFVA